MQSICILNQGNYRHRHKVYMKQITRDQEQTRSPIRVGLEESTNFSPIPSIFPPNIIIYNISSHIARLQSLKPVSDDICLDNFSRSHVCTPPKPDSRINDATSTNPAILLDGDRATLVSALGTLSFLHACMCHRTKYTDIGPDPRVSANIDGTIIDQRAVF